MARRRKIDNLHGIIRAHIAKRKRSFHCAAILRIVIYKFSQKTREILSRFHYGSTHFCDSLFVENTIQYSWLRFVVVENYHFSN